MPIFQWCPSKDVLRPECSKNSLKSVVFPMRQQFSKAYRTNLQSFIYYENYFQYTSKEFTIEIKKKRITWMKNVMKTSLQIKNFLFDWKIDKTLFVCLKISLWTFLVFKSCRIFLLSKYLVSLWFIFFSCCMFFVFNVVFLRAS